MSDIQISIDERSLDIPARRYFIAVLYNRDTAISGREGSDDLYDLLRNSSYRGATEYVPFRISQRDLRAT